MGETHYVLVTGASKGIGAATVLRLSQAGFGVLAGVRQPADGQALVSQSNGKIQPLILDITDAATIEAACSQVEQIVGEAGLAALVNNAGIGVAWPLEFVPLDEFRRALEVNLVGHLAMIQTFLPLIRKARGRIINVSSIGGLLASPFMGAYNASKFGLEALTDVLRMELLPWGIEVIAIEPGAIATPIWQTALDLSVDLERRTSMQVKTLYESELGYMRAFAAHAGEGGLPPDAVARMIQDAITARRPRTRYLVGGDAQFRRWLRWLPDRFRDRLIRSRVGGTPSKAG